QCLSMIQQIIGLVLEDTKQLQRQHYYLQIQMMVQNQYQCHLQCLQYKMNGKYHNFMLLFQLVYFTQGQQWVHVFQVQLQIIRFLYGITCGFSIPLTTSMLS
ncbi:major facilitator superfamily protein, putative, partial [Ichthyophthirius multifiliis]